MEKLLARASPGQARESTIRTARRGALGPAAPANLAGRAAAALATPSADRLLLDQLSTAPPRVLPGGAPRVDLAQRLLDQGLLRESVADAILHHQYHPYVLTWVVEEAKEPS
ncbi:hypothetical protein [Sorangium atrum]|uniref:Uncharacterized protein n=1 Tax=Sorangium atrum TaxID=2995308 RepID=A0ABT5BSB0_9BACT|nr:hypothetical protein [Sorangium aterium]MDC0677051.1 hypothetical protein [Sorangium aterium]